MITLYLDTNGDTTIQLPTPLKLDNYRCAIIEMSGNINKANKTSTAVSITTPTNQDDDDDDEVSLYLCSDICEDSILEDTKLPILRSIFVNPRNNRINKPIYNLIWLKVTRPTIDSIRLYISDQFGTPIPLANSNLKCTLVLLPIRKL